MPKPINLNRERKARAKAAKCVQAAQNRLSFGRTKPEREAQSMEQEHAACALEAHRLSED